MSLQVPHPIPYQGSKRRLAQSILTYYPRDAERLFEPFAGAAAVSMAAAFRGIADRIFLNDINGPLMDLWRYIVDSPTHISLAYERLWKAQIGKERKFYDGIRAKFNREPRPEFLLYLLARCVKASVRYNAEGQFNQSPDNRRRGMSPETLHSHVHRASAILKGKITVTTKDYRAALAAATPSDVVYMDPPYQGVCVNRDPRYLGSFHFDEFIATLHCLNERRISYILSYDGRTGEKSHGKPLQRSLQLHRIEIDTGRSSQATLLGRKANTIESIYLSPALLARIGPVHHTELTLERKQYNLLPENEASETLPRISRTPSSNQSEAAESCH